MKVYSLEGAIRDFFDNNVSPSRQECDDYARSLLGGRPVVPFTIQGQFSYTVFSPQAFADVRSGEDRSSQPTTNVKIVAISSQQVQDGRLRGTASKGYSRGHCCGDGLLWRDWAGPRKLLERVYNPEAAGGDVYKDGELFRRDENRSRPRSR